ncbi:MAG: globin domain-containing protein [Bacteroidota bacterium]
MTPLQKHLIQASWKIITPLSCTLGTLFYYRLFDLAPHTRRLFGNDIKIQAEKFVLMLDIVVESLHEFDQLSHRLTALGQRHERLNISASDFRAVRKALLWTLETSLEENWSPELDKAWGMVYDELAGVMQSQLEIKVA